ncbi:uncharacterized protein LOC130053496 [Ostrea edulis]|uniref:uncharacterized protein LOC130053496 n=1 Tax=Ostrea edulis TaxID=37623 RepID=UPI0024AFB825|nr:uncharacterized protein LOC130053496 [Ostrea edulis]
MNYHFTALLNQDGLVTGGVSIPCNTERQCPSVATNSSVTTCDGSSNAGTPVYIDFSKINSPCTCTVTPVISGELYLMIEKVTVSSCTTTIKVGNTRIYTCPTTGGLSLLIANDSQPVTVTASYKKKYNTGSFYHCLGFFQRAADIQITCGSNSTTNMSTFYTTSTEMISTEIEMTNSPTHQDNYTTVSNNSQIRCTEPAEKELAQMDDVSNIHLQIPLVLFVVIAVVSVIFNLYLSIKLRQRYVHVLL